MRAEPRPILPIGGKGGELVCVGADQHSDRVDDVHPPESQHLLPPERVAHLRLKKKSGCIDRIVSGFSVSIEEASSVR